MRTSAAAAAAEAAAASAVGAAGKLSVSEIPATTSDLDPATKRSNFTCAASERIRIILNCSHSRSFLWTRHIYISICTMYERDWHGFERASTTRLFDEVPGLSGRLQRTATGKEGKQQAINGIDIARSGSHLSRDKPSKQITRPPSNNDGTIVLGEQSEKKAFP